MDINIFNRWNKELKKLKKIPNIESFLIKVHHSKEESIDSSFSNYYGSKGFEFISSILPALSRFDFKTAMLFLNDKNFIQSLDGTKEEFDNIYKSIKNPSKYSLEAHMTSLTSDLMSELYRNFYFRELKNLLENK